MKPLHTAICLILVLIMTFMLLWFVLFSPASAQEDMAHPKTGEPGAWISRLLQKDHLMLEADLGVCQQVLEKKEQHLEVKDTEALALTLALDQEKQASEAVVDVLTATNTQLVEEERHSDKLTAWLWGTSSAAVVVLTILVLMVVL